MFGQTLASVFSNAAIPQKIVLVALAAAVPITLAATCLALANRAHDRIWRRLIAEIRIAAPALGLLVGALNTFHMARTIQRAAFDPSAKQLAPGILEVSTFVGLGALAGLLAVAASFILSLARVGHSTRHQNTKRGSAGTVLKGAGAATLALLAAVALSIFGFSIFRIFIYGLK